MVMPDQASLYLHNDMNNFPKNSLVAVCKGFFSSVRGNLEFFEFVWFVVELVGFLYLCG